MAESAVRRREVLEARISARRRLLAKAPALPWQVDVREAPALDRDTVLLRDAAGGSIAALPAVEVAELVVQLANEADAQLGLEEAVRGHREAVAFAEHAKAEGRGSDRHTASIAIWDAAVVEALKKLDRVRSRA